ncbi:MAG: 3-phosphoshikimate 1-carboxyvinyltransferase [Dehalococcoidia bacterium]|nr:3-phosphoshikimate 1-carboxyvinyltransferase [Dehalococcoidia bacterium]
MERRVRRHSAVRGDVALPGDKSISHRAAILNSLANGTAKVTNYAPGADCASTLSCLRALGVKIEAVSAETPTIAIQGVGVMGFAEPAVVLDAGNSGTTMRLLTGLLAGQALFAVITGDASLCSRPMGRVIHPLRLMGGRIYGRNRDTLAPLAIKGQELHGLDYTLPVASAQIKSAVLIAGLFTVQKGRTTVREPVLSRDHTERMLQAMGVRVTSEGPVATLAPPVSPPKAIDVHVPGDISSAACWLVLGAIHPNARVSIKGTGVNPTRTGIIDVLLKMGARLNVENEQVINNEPVADLVVESSELTAVDIGGDLVPRLIDEVPVLAVAACLARGTTVIKDAAELRVKETDRIAFLVAELSKMGANVEELPDGIIIKGGGKLNGAKCSSHGDHRMAMALGVAGAVADGETLIEDAEVVDISYPGFWQELERLTAHLAEGGQK